MALNPSVNFDSPLPTLNIVCAPQRLDTLLRRLQHLTRTGITNFVAAALGAQWQVPANVANLDEAELRATYEGPLSAAYLALSASVRPTVDYHVGMILGDNVLFPSIGVAPGNGRYCVGMSDSGIAAAVAALTTSDSSLTTVLP